MGGLWERRGICFLRLICFVEDGGSGALDYCYGAAGAVFAAGWEDVGCCCRVLQMFVSWRQSLLFGVLNIHTDPAIEAEKVFETYSTGTKRLVVGSHWQRLQPTKARTSIVDDMSIS